MTTWVCLQPRSHSRGSSPGGPGSCPSPVPGAWSGCTKIRKPTPSPSSASSSPDSTPRAPSSTEHAAPARRPTADKPNQQWMWAKRDAPSNARIVRRAERQAACRDRRRVWQGQAHRYTRCRRFQLRAAWLQLSRCRRRREPTSTPPGFELAGTGQRGRGVSSLPAGRSAWAGPSRRDRTGDLQPDHRIQLRRHMFRADVFRYAGLSCCSRAARAACSRDGNG